MAKKRSQARGMPRATRVTAARGRPAARPSAKFAGVVVMTPPEGGRKNALPNGSRVVVSIAELSLAGLPEGGAKSEVQLDVGVRTTAADGRPVGGLWSSGIHYYVPHYGRLNLAEVVIFDGVVHQHLSFDFSLVEREMPQLSADDAAAVAGAAADVAVELSGASGDLAPAFAAFPAMLGGILRLNGDDQVLKHATSLFTRDVNKPKSSPHFLLEGAYRFEKKRSGDAKGAAWVTLVVEVRSLR